MRLFRGGPTPFREGAISVSLQTDARQPCHAKRVWAQPVSNRTLISGSERVLAQIVRALGPPAAGEIMAAPIHQRINGI
jgi:hypothetical protein